MPFYCKIKSKNQGVVTQNCGSKEIAGRNSFVNEPLDKDYSLIYDWGYGFKQPHNSSFGGGDHSQAALESKVWFLFPAYHSLKVLAMNVLNSKDIIESLELYELNRVGVTKKLATVRMTDGILIGLASEAGDERHKDTGSIYMEFKFESYSHSCNLTDVTGMVKTRDAG